MFKLHPVFDIANVMNILPGKLKRKKKQFVAVSSWQRVWPDTSPCMASFLHVSTCSENCVNAQKAKTKRTSGVNWHRYITILWLWNQFPYKVLSMRIRENISKNQKHVSNYKWKIPKTTKRTTNMETRQNHIHLFSGVLLCEKSRPTKQTPSRLNNRLKWKVGCVRISDILYSYTY